MRDPDFVTGKRVTARTFLALVGCGILALIVLAVAVFVGFNLWVSSTIP